MDATSDGATFAVENIGGISTATVELRPGVTLLVGRNATNRTSFLQAIMAAHGSDWTSIRGDAGRGQVTLTLDSKQYARIVSRTGDGIVGSGNGLVADPTVANLFAFLLDDNEARRAVVRGDDLRELIMRPVDVAELRQQIREAEKRKDAIDEELDTIATLKQELPELEQRRVKKREAIADTRAELAAIEERLDERELTVDPTQTEREELQARLDELRATREELSEVRDAIQSEKESISALRDERGQLATERAGLPNATEERLTEIESRLTEHRDRERELSTYTSRLQSVIGFNQELIEGEHTGITDAIGARARSVSDITDQLMGSKTTCWTCGSSVKLDRIESTLERLRDHRQETLEEIDGIAEQIEELSEKRERLSETLERRRDLDATIESVGAEIDRRQSTVADLRERRDNLSERVEQLEIEVTELRTTAVDEVLDIHSEANQLEFELDRLESELEELNGEIEEIEREIRRDEQLVTTREEVVAELIDLRTRIDTLEAEATEQFNDRMAELLDILDYGNVERIWLERKNGPADSVVAVDTESVIAGSEFELHIVRQSEGGTVYEDTVDHLSESEREVTGLVFALAGYLVHDVHETVPFMLLDSLEAIDAERIGALVDYFAEYAPYLVVALLPEDAQALPAEYDRVTAIGDERE